MLGAYLEFHAIRRPDQIAVVNDGANVSYRQFESHVARVAVGLRRVGIRPHQRVGASINIQGILLLVVMALDRLGCAIAPIEANGSGGLGPRPDDLDWTLTDFAPSEPSPGHHFQITDDWLNTCLHLQHVEYFPPVEEAADDSVHVRLTSGTTGTPKCHEVSRDQMFARIDSRVWLHSLSARSRFLPAMEMTVGSAYISIFSSLYVGATVVFERRSAQLATVLSSVTHALMLPLHLQSALNRLPADFPKPAHLTVCCIGGRVSEELAAQTRARLATEFLRIYGANETGSIASMQSGSRGVILPGVEIKIVDEEGHSLGMGEVGRIAIRAPGMVGEYQRDDEASSRHFQDGWFWPGDIGALRGPRELELIGRDDDLLNAGGRKIAPAEVEERLAEHLPSNLEIAVCVVPHTDGVDRMAIAIAGEIADSHSLFTQIRNSLDVAFGAVLIVPLSEIPRGSSGKVRRAELKRLVAEQVGKID